MKDSCNILYQGGIGELVEKKSRFIAELRPVQDEEEAVLFIEELKKKFWDATHNCSAYLIGKNHEIQRCSDDGEPSQTAGRPMLDVLLNQDIHNVCVVVTRYFGGTLLGTGGLVRAYSGAVLEGLKHCKILETWNGKKISVKTDYSGAGKIQHMLGNHEITILERIYTDQVEMIILMPDEKKEWLIQEIQEITSGLALITEMGDISYGILNQEVILL